MEIALTGRNPASASRVSADSSSFLILIVILILFLSYGSSHIDRCAGIRDYVGPGGVGEGGGG